MYFNDYDNKKNLGNYKHASTKGQYRILKKNKIWWIALSEVAGNLLKITASGQFRSFRAEMINTIVTRNDIQNYAIFFKKKEIIKPIQLQRLATFTFVTTVEQWKIWT